MYTTDRKNEAWTRWKLCLCWSVEDSLLECLRANIWRHSSTFDFVSKPRSGKDLQFWKFSLFSTVPNTNSGRLDQRAWFTNKWYFGSFFEKWCPHFALSYRGYTTSPRTKDTTWTATSVRRSTRLVYQIWCSTASLHTRPYKATAKQK